MTTLTISSKRQSSTSRRQVRKPKGSQCPVSDYAQGVVAGTHVAGKLVRLACERHLRDLETARARDLVWSQASAARAQEFFDRFLVHTKAEWAGQKFDLINWQKFVVGSIFGWLRDDGYRRFRHAFVSTARKNGKSELEAGIGLYGLLADGEEGTEIYSAATKRDQAKIVWGQARRMCELSPLLRKRVGIHQNNLHVTSTASKFEPLSADDKTLDGLHVHMALVDEVHEHKDDQVIVKLETATGARRQPLVYETTTAGVNRHSVCYEHWRFCEQMLDGSLPAEATDHWFAFIATLDVEDDWRDEAVWIKANPSLGVTPRLETLRRSVSEAEASPARQNSVRRLYLNQWTEQVTRWLSVERWASLERGVDYDALRGRRCYGGLDLARVNDLSALCLLFPPVEAGEPWIAIWRCWVPEEDIVMRADRDRVPYPLWRDQGWLETTPGNVTDFKFIQAAIVDLSGIYDIQEIAYDRTFAGELVTNLMDEGVPLVEFGQGFYSMGPPCSELERLIIGGEIAPENNPVARWAASNVTVRADPAGNIKPDKERSTERIDPIVALVMALGRAQLGFDGGGSYLNDEDAHLLVL